MSSPCDFVIFGGTGDLAVRKLLPALYLRDRDGQLTADTRIIAVARAGLDEAGYRDKIHAELGRFVAAELLDTDTVDRFLSRLRFVSIDLTQPSDYVAVADVLSTSTIDIRVFYLACAPALFGSICDALARQDLVAMEPPTHIDRETVRDEKLKVLQALAPLSADDIKRRTVTGQYGPGLSEGGVVNGYREDAENPDSSTETFVAVKAEINNWRWAEVPFYLRTGKRMSRRYSEIVVQFKPPPSHANLPTHRRSRSAATPNRAEVPS